MCSLVEHGSQQYSGKGQQFKLHTQLPRVLLHSTMHSKLMAGSDLLTADTQCSRLAARQYCNLPKQHALQGLESTLALLQCLPGCRHHAGHGQEVLKHPQAPLEQQCSLMHSVAEARGVCLQGRLHARLEGLQPRGMQVAQLLVERAAYCAEHLLQQLRPLGLAHARLEVAGLVIIPCTAVPQCQAGLFCGNCSVCEPFPQKVEAKQHAWCTLHSHCSTH